MAGNSAGTFVDRDLRACWEPWIGTAELLDEPGLVLALRQASPTRAERDASYAHALLLDEQVEPATAVLAAQGVTPPDAAATPTYEQVVLAAARAAGGDVDAWVWLRTLLTRTESGERALVLRLVAAAGEMRGDYPTADRAWLELAQVLAGSAPVSMLAPITVARISRRKAAEPREALAVQVARLAAMTLEVDPAGRSTAGRVGQVVDGLLVRGDARGARAFVGAVTLLVPDPDLRQLAGSIAADAGQPAWSRLAVRTSAIADGSVAALMAARRFAARPVARAREAAGDEAAPGCSCDDVSASLGIAAERLVRAHLVAAETPAELRDAGAAVFLCPDTAAPWLVAHGRHRLPIALRGARAASADDDAWPGMYL